MKAVSVFFLSLALALRAPGAAGDVVSAVVTPDSRGEVTFSGLGPGGSYDFGLGANNDPDTGTPKVTFTVVSLGYDELPSASTVTRLIYGTEKLRVPILTPAIPGTHNSGTFLAGEPVTQANTNATGTVLFPYGAGTTVFDVTLSPTSVMPDNSSQWTGGTSGATFTSTGAADTKGTFAGMYFTQGCAGNSGTFQLNEPVTQATSGAAGVCKFAGAASGPITFAFVLNPGSAPANAANQWTGGTSNAKCTPTSGATPAQSQSDYRAQEWYNGTNTVVRFALSRPLASKDKTGGGNSGTAPTVNILGGFYTKSGTPNNASGAGFAVTNNSTRTYTLPMGQWDGVAGVRTAERVSGSSFDVAFNMRLAEPEGIAAVVFTASGQTSMHTETVTVTRQTPTRRSATGLYGCAYKATIPLAGFTSGESIDLRAQGYPAIGDTILDTNSYTTATEEIRGRNKATVVYNSTLKYAIVDPSLGSNSNTGSTTEGTARSAPIQHMGKAVQNDCNVIKLVAGTHPAMGTISSTRRATNEWYRIIPDDGLTSNDVTVQIGTAHELRCARVQFEGVKITLASTFSWLDGDAGTVANFVRFKNCVFDGSGVGTPSAPPCYNAYGGYFDNCTGDLNDVEWKLTTTGGQRIAAQFDGCQFGTTGSAQNTVWYRVMASNGGAGAFFGSKATANPAPPHDNLIFENSRLMNQTGSPISISVASIESMTLGCSISGNLVERTDEGGPAFWFKGDLTALSIANASITNNTIQGGRCSWMYADTFNSNAYTCTNYWISGNMLSVLGTKHDTSATSLFDGRNTQIWNVLYGESWSGNVSEQLAGNGGAGIAMNEFIGLRSYQPAFNGNQQPRNGTPNALTFGKYVNRLASTGTGTNTGNSDYRLQSDSPGRRKLLGKPALPYNQNGKPWALNGDNAGYWPEGGVRPASMFFGLN